jgi:hypothetical protein
VSTSSIDLFVKRLCRHTKEKAKLYDGGETFAAFIQRDGTEPFSQVDFGIRLAVEELGEIASAITRSRRRLAAEECIDLAHCAYLIWVVLNKEGSNI